MQTAFIVVVAAALVWVLFISPQPVIEGNTIAAFAVIVGLVWLVITFWRTFLLAAIAAALTYVLFVGYWHVPPDNAFGYVLFAFLGVSALRAFFAKP